MKENGGNKMKEKYENTIIQINELIENYKKDISLTNYSEEDGGSHIYLDLSSKEIYQEFSNQSLLREEIFDFIEKTYPFTKRNSKLTIHITFAEETTSAEKKKIKDLIRIHYAIKFKETNHEIWKTNLKGTISLMIGAALFAVYGLLEWFNVNFIFIGIIEIFSWVFIWEACSLYTFTNGKNKLDRFKYFRLYNSQELE